MSERSLPPEVQAFIQTNQQELHRFDERINELVKGCDTLQDRKAVKQLLEEENALHADRRLMSGLITCMPAYMDHGPSIRVRTDSKQVYDLFNSAARRSLQLYHPFHQIGSYYTERDFDTPKETGWELFGEHLPSAHYIIHELLETAVEIARDVLR